jgi:hypothetical protein
LLSIFGFSLKKRENTKNKYQKIFERNPKKILARKGCWNTEKRSKIG